MKPFPFRKCLSAFVAAAVLLIPPVSAAPAPETSRREFHIDVPKNLGRIEETFTGPSGKTVIYIQDAHDSLEAQKNIARLVRHFVEKDGVRTVFGEGYEGPVPTDDFFGFIRSPEIKEKVSYFLMDRLRLGGAEYAHVNRERDFALIGADSRELHLENITAYREAARHRDDIAEDLALIGGEIERLIQLHFPNEFKEWLKIKNRYHEGKLGLLDYLKRTGPEGDYPHIRMLLEAAEDSRMSERLNGLDPRALFLEIAEMEKAHARKFLKNERDLKIYEYETASALLKRLNRIEVTAAEYDALKETLGILTTRELADFIAQHGRRSVVLSSRWEEHIRHAVRFYETAETRDRAVEKRLEDFMKGDEETAVLVFGGFHKDRIRQILRNLGYSGVVITPAITEIDPRHQAYYKQLMGAGYLPYETRFLPARAAKQMVIYGEPFARDAIRTLYAGALSGDIEAYLNAPKSELRTLAPEDRPKVEAAGMILQGLLAAREQYDVASGSWTPIAGVEGLLAKGPYDITMVLGSPDNRVAREAAVLAKPLLQQNPEMKILTSGKGGSPHGFELAPEDRGVPEAVRYKRIMEEMGVTVDFTEEFSTNSGMNITESRKVIDLKKIKPARFLLIQTPQSQKRTGATFLKQYPLEGETLESLGVQSVTVYAPYLRDLSALSDEELITVVREALEEMERAHNYAGKFMVPVAIPDEALEAEAYLRSLPVFASRPELREPDEAQGSEDPQAEWRYLVKNWADLNPVRIHGQLFADEKDRGFIILGDSLGGKSALSVDLLKSGRGFRIAADDDFELIVYQGRLFGRPSKNYLPEIQFRATSPGSSSPSYRSYRLEQGQHRQGILEIGSILRLQSSQDNRTLSPARVSLSPEEALELLKTRRRTEQDPSGFSRLEEIQAGRLEVWNVAVPPYHDYYQPFAGLEPMIETIWGKRSELREDPPEEGLLSEPRDPMNSEGDIWMSVETFRNLTAAQKDELFGALSIRDGVRLNIFGDRTRIPHDDPAFSAILKLRAVRLLEPPTFEEARRKLGPHGVHVLLLTAEEAADYRSDDPAILLTGRSAEIELAGRVAAEETSLPETQGVYEASDFMLELLNAELRYRVIAYSA